MEEEFKTLNEYFYPPLIENTLCSCLKAIAEVRELKLNDLLEHTKQFSECEVFKIVAQRKVDCIDFGCHHRLYKRYKDEYLPLVNGLINRCKTEKQNALEILRQKVDIEAYWTFIDRSWLIDGLEKQVTFQSFEELCNRAEMVGSFKDYPELVILEQDFFQWIRMYHDPKLDDRKDQGKSYLVPEFLVAFVQHTYDVYNEKTRLAKENFARLRQQEQEEWCLHGTAETVFKNQIVHLDVPVNKSDLIKQVSGTQLEKGLNLIVESEVDALREEADKTLGKEFIKPELLKRLISVEEGINGMDEWPEIRLAAWVELLMDKKYFLPKHKRWHRKSSKEFAVLRYQRKFKSSFLPKQDIARNTHKNQLEHYLK